MCVALLYLTNFSLRGRSGLLIIFVCPLHNLPLHLESAIATLSRAPTSPHIAQFAALYQTLEPWEALLGIIAAGKRNVLNLLVVMFCVLNSLLRQQIQFF